VKKVVLQYLSPCRTVSISLQADGQAATGSAATTAGSRQPSAAAADSKQPSAASRQRQGDIVAAMQLASRRAADNAVAMFFFAEGISFFKARSPFFKDIITAVAAAGPGYVPPAYNWANVFRAVGGAWR